MTTTNIVSTPNITGNVGSCTTDSVEVDSSQGFFKIVGKNYTTNSCTGQVIISDTTSIGVGVCIVGSFLLVGLILTFIVYVISR